MELTFSRVLVTVEGTIDNVEQPEILAEPEQTADVEVKNEVVAKAVETERKMSNIPIRDILARSRRRKDWHWQQGTRRFHLG